MKLCVNTNIASGDWTKLSGLCAGLGIENVVLGLQAMIQEGKGIIPEPMLRKTLDELGDGGFSVPVAALPAIPNEVLLGEGQDRIEELCLNLRTVGEAGIRTVLVFPWVEKCGDAREDDQRWGAFCRVYEQIVGAAEESGVCLAAHGHRTGKYFLTDSRSYRRLLETIPSPANGMTFCMGCLHFAGDDLSRCAAGLSEKIYLVHARDLRKAGGDGIHETSLGEGEVDVLGALEALREAGYDGPIAAEHMPPVPWDGHGDLLAHVMAIGFLKATLMLSERRCTCP